MSSVFDPNVPSGFLTITGDFTSAVQVKEVPAIGVGNLVLDPTHSFDIKVDWMIDGNIAELWLSALAVAVEEQHGDVPPPSSLIA